MTLSRPTYGADAVKAEGRTRRLARIPLAFAVPVALLFGAAGRWNWPAAWVYLGLMMGGGFSALFVFAKLQPELVAERTEHWRDGKAWDKPLVVVLALVGPSIVQLVCGLDERFAWSPPVSIAVQAAGALAFAIGTAIVAWAMAVNRFFSSVVRIQTDRGHRVVDTGPYRYVRHPGYAGMLLATIGTPMLLGSWWGCVPSTVIVAVLVVRTALEDRTLRAELTGYREYSLRVRRRLVPLLW